MSDSAGELTPARVAVWAQQAKRISTLIQRARHSLASGRGSTDDILFEAQEAATDHQRGLIAAAGVHVDVPPIAPIPLDKLDTATSRELLATLRQAVEIAERVDAERGRGLSFDVPTLPGETRGIDLAETLNVIARRVELEVEGPQTGRE